MTVEMKDCPQVTQILSKYILFFFSRRRQFEFLERLEPFLSLNIAKCELQTFAQFYFLNFVSDLLVNLKISMVTLFMCSLVPLRRI